MKAFSNIVLFITTEDEEEAKRISRVLLEKKKAACVNILTADSHFWWEGNIESAQESLLIVKSKASLLSEIVDLVRKAHSYEVPEIIALPIIGGNQDYLNWINDNVS